ncbi:hypothetical protein QBC47DRAFT_382573 [Echria macrotheca]|uniref:Uncharacterized protein n=1 Tax=Echria macrotheca TaxID=438768 RepID=A0AAJ0FB78_9PEZI|nr:hypothetical protein QBC47DRAFT_382573 [Echria macrotheca]
MVRTTEQAGRQAVFVSVSSRLIFWGVVAAVCCILPTRRHSRFRTKKIAREVLEWTGLGWAGWVLSWNGGRYLPTHRP